MTKNADFKKRVRARMAKTGESYATARSHFLTEQRQDPPAGQSMLAALHVSNGDATDLPGTGGVHLRGRHVPWRWDDATETLTPA